MGYPFILGYTWFGEGIDEVIYTGLQVSKAREGTAGPYCGRYEWTFLHHVTENIHKFLIREIIHWSDVHIKLYCLVCTDSLVAAPKLPFGQVNRKAQHANTVGLLNSGTTRRDDPSCLLMSRFEVLLVYNATRTLACLLYFKRFELR